MNSTLFNQFCNSINYNTYENIRKLTWIGGMEIAVINSLFEQYPFIENSLEITAGSLLTLYLYLSFSQGKNNTKDIIEIKALYKELIKKYNKLNKMFNLTNPIEIYTMFDFSLNEGYLSKDKKFTFTAERTTNIYPIKGANILAGKGVCRHIAAMQTDILTDYGLEAYNITGYYKDETILVTLSEKPKCSKEEALNFIAESSLNPNEKQYLYDKIEEYEKKGIHVSFSLSNNDEKAIEKIIGNHALTYAIDENFGYFLDATHSVIYRLKENEKNVLLNDSSLETINIKLPLSILLNQYQEYRKLKATLKRNMPSIPIEEQKRIQELTQKTCSQNIDIFEHFYQENKELYHDVAKKLSHLPK